MRQYSKLSINENEQLCKSTEDRFYMHAHNRMQCLKESGTYNDGIHGLFQDSFSETSMKNLLEQFYLKNFKGDYDTLLERFNQFTETKSEQQARFNKLLERYCGKLNSEPYDCVSHKLLDEAIIIDRPKTIAYLINEGCNILKKIDVRNLLRNTLFESEDAKQACLTEIKDDPNIVLGLAESISRGVRYAMREKLEDPKLNQKVVKFLESLNNIYSIYKEGMDIVQTQETQASQMFELFIHDKATNYYFATCNIEKTLKDPASFVQLGIRYFDSWMNNHRNRLAYKFEVSSFERLADMKKIFEAEHPLLFNQPLYQESLYTFPKMYQLLDLLLSISQYLRMDLRNLTCKYISVIRPMIDSYRTDYQRSKTRAGY